MPNNTDGSNSPAIEFVDLRDNDWLDGLNERVAEDARIRLVPPRMAVGTETAEPVPTAEPVDPEVERFHRMYPDLGIGIENERDAENGGWSLTGDCNCSTHRGERRERLVQKRMAERDYAGFNFTESMFTQFSETGEPSSIGPKFDPDHRVPSHTIFLAESIDGPVRKAGSRYLNEALTKTCSSCGLPMWSGFINNPSYVEFGIYLLPNGVTMCRGCFKSQREFFDCLYCQNLRAMSDEGGNDNWVKVDHMDQGSLVCVDCYDHEFEECAECGNAYPSDDMNSVDGDWFCEQCFNERYVWCHGCDSARDREGAGEVGDWWMCRDCLENDCSICNECDHWTLSENGHTDDDGEFVCNSCRNAREDEIHEHNYKPRPVFRRIGAEPVASTLFFGYELEVENIMNRVSINDMSDWNDKFWEGRDNGQFVYCKHDGSLHYGVEFVSHPFSWAWFTQHQGELKEWLGFIRSKGYRSYSTGTCGLHVHMNKSAFDGTRLYKWMKFFHENGDFIYEISGRRSRGDLHAWARVDDVGADKKNLIYEARNKMKAKDGRYWAVNLVPRNTIEIRIFKGTLANSSFFRAIEFLRALYQFCEKGRVKIRGVTLAGFKEYMNAESATYPNLAKKMLAIKTDWPGMAPAPEGAEYMPMVSPDAEEW